MTLATVTSVEGALRQNVMSELAADPSVGEIEIGAAVEDGMVTLTGHVESLRERIAAERAVKRVEGVRCVVNDLLVRQRSQRTDTEIAREALHRLRNNVSVPLEVQAVVSDGCITLDGIVNWMYERVAAENAVRYLPRVRRVVNDIALRIPPRA
jgi:osmotically-inducible protein OsmY